MFYSGMTGTQIAALIYLFFSFRCLRFVSQSWQSFAEFSTSPLEVTDASNKRRKLSDEDGGLTSSKAFGDAKECLVSLKNTLEDLHRKDLFPYNPKALLRRYIRSNKKVFSLH